MSESKKRGSKLRELENYSESYSYRKIKCEYFTVEGFSRAPVMTFWRIPEYKLGFDLGWQPWEFMGTPRWFLSHAHMDHVLALPAYIARRRMMQMEPPTIYVPEQKVGDIRQFLGAFCRLEQSVLPCEIIGVRPGDEIDLSRELVVSVHRTYHTVPSVGYIVWERRKKLKLEYLELSGPEIRDLSVSGVEVSYEVRFPRIAFLGDSSPRGLDENPDMYKADVLIAEMTHVSTQKNEPRQTPGHMRVEDYVERKDKFQNKKIIASHFSVRYAQRDVENCVKQKLPDMLGGRLVLV
ncbi:MAG: MBL fold metallo-hydrolase [Thermoguttaceae bacterium]|nr:MBL fold metallo-hydrolase [Thermoguttaceae bacterium]